MWLKPTISTVQVSNYWAFRSSVLRPDLKVFHRVARIFTNVRATGKVVSTVNGTLRLLVKCWVCHVQKLKTDPFSGLGVPTCAQPRQCLGFSFLVASICPLHRSAGRDIVMQAGHRKQKPSNIGSWHLPWVFLGQVR